MTLFVVPFETTSEHGTYSSSLYSVLLMAIISYLTIPKYNFPLKTVVASVIHHRREQEITCPIQALCLKKE